MREIAMHKPDWRKVAVTALLFVVSILFLLPFFWMLVTLFKIEKDVFVYPIQWIPKQWNAIANYKEVWFGDYPFYVYYLNSIKVSVITTLISCTTASLAAYGFSKVRFKAKERLQQAKSRPRAGFSICGRRSCNRIVRVTANILKK